MSFRKFVAAELKAVHDHHEGAEPRMTTANQELSRIANHVLPGVANDINAYLNSSEERSKLHSSRAKPMLRALLTKVEEAPERIPLDATDASPPRSSDEPSHVCKKLKRSPSTGQWVVAEDHDF
jgi:hypothetical protein